MIELCLSSHAIKFSWSEIWNVAFERGFKIQHMSVTSHICVLIVSLYHVKMGTNASLNGCQKLLNWKYQKVSRSISNYTKSSKSITSGLQPFDIHIHVSVTNKFITHKRNVWDPSRVVPYFLIFIEKFTFFTTTNAKYHFNENVIP